MRCNERRWKGEKVEKSLKNLTYVKCFANILPGAPKSLKSLRFSRQIVLCMHRTLASLLRISSSSGVWKFTESLNLPLTRENFCRAVWNSWFIPAILFFAQPAGVKCLITVSKLRNLPANLPSYFRDRIRFRESCRGLYLEGLFSLLNLTASFFRIFKFNNLFFKENISSRK